MKTSILLIIIMVFGIGCSDTDYSLREELRILESKKDTIQEDLRVSYKADQNAGISRSSKTLELHRELDKINKRILELEWIESANFRSELEDAKEEITDAINPLIYDNLGGDYMEGILAGNWKGTNSGNQILQLELMHSIGSGTKATIAYTFYTNNVIFKQNFLIQYASDDVALMVDRKYAGKVINTNYIVFQYPNLQKEAVKLFRDY